MGGGWARATSTRNGQSIKEYSLQVLYKICDFDNYSHECFTPPGPSASPGDPGRHPREKIVGEGQKNGPKLGLETTITLCLHHVQEGRGHRDIFSDCFSLGWPGLPSGVGPRCLQHLLSGTSHSGVSVGTWWGPRCRFSRLPSVTRPNTSVCSLLRLPVLLRTTVLLETGITDPSLLSSREKQNDAPEFTQSPESRGQKTPHTRRVPGSVRGDVRT